MCEHVSASQCVCVHQLVLRLSKYLAAHNALFCLLSCLSSLLSSLFALTPFSFPFFSSRRHRRKKKRRQQKNIVGVSEIQGGVCVCVCLSHSLTLSLSLSLSLSHLTLSLSLFLSSSFRCSHLSFSLLVKFLDAQNLFRTLFPTYLFELVESSCCGLKLNKLKTLS